MGVLEDREQKLYPAGTPIETPAPTPDANSSNAVSPMIDRENKLYPPAAPSDEDITGSGWNSRNFWNLPPGVSQGDYWGAEGRKIADIVRGAAADTAKIYADDQTFGMGTQALAKAQGNDPAAYQAEINAARERAGGGKYGIDAMAYLTSPARWVGTGLKAEQLAQAGIQKIAPGTTANIARRIGDFVEGGLYTGAQTAGHGEGPEATAESAAEGGIFSAGLGAVAQRVAPWARAIRERVYGTPEGTPAEIAAGPPPGAPPRTAEQDMDARQMNLWRSQAAHDMVPSQAGVGNYAAQVYGPDPANWPAALRDIHNAAGREGAPSLAARIIGHSATQAGTATAQYLGLGFSPEVAAVLHPAAIMATEKVLPALTGYGSAPVRSALANAYPALTGWRPEMSTPGWRY